MNRQSIIMILIGAIATLSGLAVFDYLRGRRCAELSGAWDGASRTCRLGTGDAAGTITLLAVVGGLVVALAAGFMLYRVLTFALGRHRSASP